MAGSYGKYSISMTPEQMKSIDVLAESIGLSRSELIRRAVDHYGRLPEVKAFAAMMNRKLP